MTDSTTSDDDSTGLPDEPAPDAFEWTSEPEQPDVAGMPGEFVNEAGDGVPGVRRGESPAPKPDDRDFDQESNT